MYDCGVTDKTEISRLVYLQQTTQDDLAHLFERLQGEETDQTAALESMLSETSEDIFELLGAWLVELDGRIALAKVQTDRLADVVAVAEGRKEWAESRVRDLMKASGEKCHTAGTFTFRLRLGVRKAVYRPGPEPAELPERFVRTVVETRTAHDKAEILRALKAGEAVPDYVIERGLEGVSVK